MGDATGAELTAEGLVEALAQAGEFDAGAEALDAVCAREPDLSGRVRLQALLFAVGPVPEDTRRAVLDGLRARGLESVARRGDVRACAAAYRVLSATFPDDTVLADKRARFDLLVTPLGGQGDSRRATVDGLLARGAIAEAFELLRDLARETPGDGDITRRVEALRGVVFDPTHTQPYRAMVVEDAARVLTVAGASASTVPPPPEPTASPDVLLHRVTQAIQAGDVSAALRDVSALSHGQPGNTRWIRLRDALARLAVPAEPTGDDSPTVAITQRLSPVAQVDTWLRQGRLRDARDQARVFLSGPTTSEMDAALSQRLSDLCVVLDGTLPTPLPPTYAEDTVEDTARGTVLVPQGPEPVVTVSSAVETAPGVGVRDTAPINPVSPGEAQPTGGDVRLRRRKIVRLE